MTIRLLNPSDAMTFAAMLRLFGEVFDDRTTYDDAPPDGTYVATLLADPHFIALVATDGDAVIGALAAYILPKFERARSEVYIYDLAVVDGHRRCGVATSLIDALKPIAKQHRAWVIFVQADRQDAPAIALYRKLGVQEEVLHFDIPLD